MKVYCHECGASVEIIGYERALRRPQIICARCHFDLTGEDEERDAREARERVTESPREGTEA